MDDKPRILVAMRPALYDQLFAPAWDAQLRELGALTFQSQDGNLTSAQLAAQIGGHDIVITGWGSPVFTAEVLESAERLRLIAHSAGSIKRTLPPAVFAEGRRVTHAAAAMGPAVSEAALLLILLSLRQFHQMDRALRRDSWRAARSLAPGEELAGKRVGVIGAGHTGRAVIKALQALKAEVWVYDPYLSEAAAAELGVVKVSLEKLMRECPVVTLQAPATAETYRLLGAEQFSWLGDGAIFVNTARAHLVDEAALLAELASGRIHAALDVFAQEPLPADSPFRQLDNVIITPHAAAHTRQARGRQGRIVTEELTRYLREGTLRYEVTRDMLATMA